ncbi:TfoX/Sxy family protein [Devosia sp. 2618]|uniref:TfoX/Sxy family protein n=1 Tax=Devosia sp. 2618 TaxID=3156454 RepID=UPI00339553FF
MSSQRSTIDYIIEQVEAAGRLSSRLMFGEYALYCDGKIVAYVCDDQFYIKPTDAGRAYLGEITEGHPYPGSKPYFLIEGDRWDDSDWLTELVRVTAAELPVPKAKK